MKVSWDFILVNCDRSKWLVEDARLIVQDIPRNLSDEEYDRICGEIHENAPWKPMLSYIHENSIIKKLGAEFAFFSPMEYLDEHHNTRYGVDWMQYKYGDGFKHSFTFHLSPMAREYNLKLFDNKLPVCSFFGLGSFGREHSFDASTGLVTSVIPRMVDEKYAWHVLCLSTSACELGNWLAKAASKKRKLSRIIDPLEAVDNWCKFSRVPADKTPSRERVRKAYETLKLKAGATVKVVQRTFRKRALTCHPDKVSSEEAALEFELISEARTVLVSHLNRVRE